MLMIMDSWLLSSQALEPFTPLSQACLKILVIGTVGLILEDLLALFLLTSRRLLIPLIMKYSATNLNTMGLNIGNFNGFNRFFDPVGNSVGLTAKAPSWRVLKLGTTRFLSWPSSFPSLHQ